MKTTINDVAAHAGVSIKTVSRVTNNEPSVRPATKEKVIAAIKALNYQPSLAARNLATTKSYTIAFIYDNPNAYYIIDMQNGILKECRQQGFELLIHPCDAKQPNIVDELMAMLTQSQIAGIVLTPPFSEMSMFIDKLAEANISFVRILSGSAAPDSRSPCVLIDDHQAAYCVTEHLIALGHQHIAFLCGEDAHQSTSQRLSGYRAALKAHRLPVEPTLIVDGEYSFDSGVQGANTVLNAEIKPSAIFCCNDEIAAGALFASRIANINVPQQLSIVGFENSPFSRQTWPKLTTADQPNLLIAQKATEMLIAHTKLTKLTANYKVFTPALVSRDSSARYVKG